MFDTLKQLNFTDNEIKLYMWLLGNGEHTAAEAARNLDMDKSSAYRAAETLANLGALYKSERKRGTTYEALNPDILKDIYNQKKSQIISLESGIDDLVKNLQANSTDKRNTLIKIERDYDAHIRLMELSLEDNPEKLIQEYWDLDNPIFSLGRYSRYLDSFIKRRLKKNIKIEYLARLDPSKYYDIPMDPSPKFKKQIRIIPPEFTNRNAFRLWGDYAEIISFDENGKFIVITIKDRIVIGLLRDVFRFIWKVSKVYTR